MKKCIILIGILSVYLMSCSPSVESETKAWEANQLKVKDLTTQYPAFASMLSETLEQAKNKWKESEAISDEKLKAEKMDEANALLESGPVEKLSSAKDMLEDIQDKIRELNQLLPKYPEYNENGMIAIQNAQNYMDEINQALYPSYGNYTSAEAINNINMVAEKVNLSLGGIEVIYDQIMQLENKTTADTSQNSSTNNTNNLATDVTCEYCKKSNLSEAKECKYCGAPISK